MTGDNEIYSIRKMTINNAIIFSICNRVYDLNLTN